MSDTTNATTDVVADVAEEVAEQATQLAQTSRGLSSHDLNLVFGGLAVGAGLGGVLGYIFCKRRLETKYSQIAAEEIAGMRQTYAAKKVALESEAGKANLETLVRDRGYAAEPSPKPPMAIEPPDAVVDAAREAAEEDGIETPPSEPSEVTEIDTSDSAETRNVFRDNEVDDEWDYHKEKARRSPLEPYVIHRDERDEQDAYEGVTFTYYEDDDVLCNERDEVIPEDERSKLIGEANLEKFGHGSEDANIVYIRNDSIETDFEIVRSPNSYAKEVHGLEHSSRSRRRERTAFDDE